MVDISEVFNPNPLIPNREQGREEEAFRQAGWEPDRDFTEEGRGSTSFGKIGSLRSLAATLHVREDEPDEIHIPSNDGTWRGKEWFHKDGDRTPPDSAWRIKHLFETVQNPTNPAEMVWKKIRTDTPESLRNTPPQVPQR